MKSILKQTCSLALVGASFSTTVMASAPSYIEHIKPEVTAEIRQYYDQLGGLNENAPIEASLAGAIGGALAAFAAREVVHAAADAATGASTEIYDNDFDLSKEERKEDVVVAKVCPVTLAPSGHFSGPELTGRVILQGGLSETQQAQLISGIDRISKNEALLDYIDPDVTREILWFNELKQEEKQQVLLNPEASFWGAIGRGAVVGAAVGVAEVAVEAAGGTASISRDFVLEEALEDAAFDLR